MTNSVRASIAVLILATAGRVEAAGWYGVLRAHWSEPGRGDSSYEVPPMEGEEPGSEEPARTFDFNSNLAAGAHFAVAAGWHRDDILIRPEMEFRRFEGEIRSFGSPESGQLASGDATADMLTVSALLDLKGLAFLPASLTPYIGLGAGVAEVVLGGRDDRGVLGRAGFGVSYRVYPRLTLDAGLDYVETQRLRYPTADGVVTTVFSATSASISARYYWGSTAD